MGGKKTFCQMLDSVFAVPPIFDDSYYGYTIHEIREMQIMNMGNYAHGNQPIQHMIYLYNYGGQPWKAQYWIHQVMDRLYSATPDGYCGDEDNGQTSAWYVFSALGFYPVCPGSNQYVIGSPYLNRVTLHLENGKTVTLTRESKGCYIQSMTVDGRKHTSNYFNHNQLTKGCSIRFVMGDKPNTRRGTGTHDLPYSFSLETISP
jgi:predicted alpha-1,2-mannosidase